MLQPRLASNPQRACFNNLTGKNKGFIFISTEWDEIKLHRFSSAYDMRKKYQVFVDTQSPKFTGISLSSHHFYYVNFSIHDARAMFKVEIRAFFFLQYI